MRIADIVFRQGHLSEDALTAAVLAGSRPDHLDRCDECTRRALELGRWLDDVRALGLEAADEAFPPEKLAMQQAQVLRRLEQLDEPPRVIAFPAQAISAPRSESRRRVAPAWVGVAAAAGLVIGVISGQMSARATAPLQAPATTPAALAPTPADPVNASLLDLDLERHVPLSLQTFDEITPTMVQAQAR